MSAFFEISFILAIATVVAMLMHRLRLPLILGHIATGVLVGPAVFNIIQAKGTLEIFSQLGITALLFIVGLGLNPYVFREVGKVAVLTGIGQIVFTTGVGFLLALAFGYAWTSAFFIAIALTFSSTIIIMKLLSDRGETGRLYGKIAIGFLLVQDVVATALLVVVSTLTPAAGIGRFLFLLGFKMAVAIAAAVLFSRFLLPRLTRLFATSQEFLFLFSVGWGLGLAALFYALGLSIEMGALAAGVTLAASPYRYEIDAKMRLLRDFFIIMFFVLLGSQLTWQSLGAQWLPAAIFSAFVLIGNPVIIMILMGWLGYSKKVSFFAGLTVAQVSEFSFLLILLAAQRGYVAPETLSLVTTVGIITITLSTILILKADALYARLSPWLGIFERRHPLCERLRRQHFDAILFGCHRVGADFISTLKRRGTPFLVVDFDPAVIAQLEERGVACRYGDAHDNEFLEELGLARVKLVVSTIPDFETNMLILQKVKKCNRGALMIASGRTLDEAQRLYQAGATYVIMPHFLGGNQAAMLLERHGYNKKRLALERQHHLEHLAKR